MLPTINIVTVDQHLDNLRREAHRWQLAGLVLRSARKIRREQDRAENKSSQHQRTN